MNKKNYNLNFEIFFESDNCIKTPLGGRMQILKKQNKEFLLVTTGADREEDGNLSQDRNSIFGKILKFDLINRTYNIYSKGHRNPQGLIVYNNHIISTEHGPRGGDEINLILENKNYGWPIASYGDLYSRQVSKDKSLESFEYADHENNFEEPIFTFIPSIAISEIINIDTRFSKKFKNNFFICSLGARSLFRVKFSSNFSRLIFYEKIYIGERIRDIKYSVLNNKYILALEDGSIGLVGPL